MSFIHASPMCSRPLTNRPNMTTPKISTEIKLPVLVGSSDDHLFLYEVFESSGGLVARCETEEMAHAIAIALNSQPDLIKACEVVLKVVEECDPDTRRCYEPVLQAALKKAKPL